MSGSVTGSDCDWSGCREPGTHQVHVEHSEMAGTKTSVSAATMTTPSKRGCVKKLVRSPASHHRLLCRPPWHAANAGAYWTNRRDCQQISASRARTADLPSARSASRPKTDWKCTTQ